MVSRACLLGGRQKCCSLDGSWGECRVERLPDRLPHWVARMWGREQGLHLASGNKLQQHSLPLSWYLTAAMARANCAPGRTAGTGGTHRHNILVSCPLGQARTAYDCGQYGRIIDNHKAMPWYFKPAAPRQHDTWTELHYSWAAWEHLLLEEIRQGGIWYTYRCPHICWQTASKSRGVGVPPVS